MNFKKIIFLTLLLVVLGAASCGDKTASVVTFGDMLVTTAINNDNTPVGNLPVILDTSPKIYTAIELINAKRGDSVQVVWRYLAQDKIIATETFTGRRAQDRPYDFVGGPGPATSWLASLIALTDLNWPNGDYEVSAELNRKAVKKIGFTVATENELDTANKKAMIKSIWLGKGINSNHQIVSPTTIFAKTDTNIYAVVLTNKAPARTPLEAKWTLLETGEVINEFATSATGSEYISFVLNLAQSGKTVWVKGNYTFSLFVDNTLVATKNFQVN
ncbi:TPA: hypothetical protein DIV45_00985 [Patescibacteria group bacterium]|uniref:Uncharacterized protein n=1 Tax=candidate division Kazan bacterium GW2011_GWA1_44_22 TaxID=1620410 RepID=A0A0G1KYD2_UNCK3|nr:MAG: hypothetical protein VE96_C0005G0003 [candidate division Kazan bacterium GW2011_GWA1_44_22]HCR41927.1 hypothetical protein [Patescibacteria group bacterium]